MKRYAIDVIMKLDPGEALSWYWWGERYFRGALRAGGMPDEVSDPLSAQLTEENDPESGRNFARVTLPLPPGTGPHRARELAHMLCSVLTSEGYTLRDGGEVIETLPESPAGEPEASFGGPAYAEGRVSAGGCLTCALAAETRLGCCGQGAAFSLADLGAALLDGDEPFVERCLALPGEPDGAKWHPYLVQGRCRFHDPAQGCTLPPTRMPLQCRTYLCKPERLLPPALLKGYEGYVDALDRAEEFIGEAMRQSGVGFTSSTAALKAAAAQAFAAWTAEN